MSSAASLLLLAAILIVFLGGIALLVVVLDKLFGELLRTAWRVADDRPVATSSSAREGDPLRARDASMRANAGPRSG